MTIYHILKLFQSPPEAQNGKKNLVSEFYEEIVFQDPTQLMQHLLSSTRPITLGAWKHETDCDYYFVIYSLNCKLNLMNLFIYFFSRSKKTNDFKSYCGGTQ